MTHQDLKQAILDYVRCIYEAEFTGIIKIEDLDPVGYKVDLYLDNDEYPLSIMADLEDDKFLEFIKEELRSRKLIRQKHYRVTKLSPIYNKALSMPNVRIVAQAPNTIKKSSTKVNVNTTSGITEWVGTIEEFNALPTHSNNITYYIVE